MGEGHDGDCCQDLEKLYCPSSEEDLNMYGGRLGKLILAIALVSFCFSRVSIAQACVTSLL